MISAGPEGPTACQPRKLAAAEGLKILDGRYMCTVLYTVLLSSEVKQGNIATARLHHQAQPYEDNCQMCKGCENSVRIACQIVRPSEK